MENEVEQKTKIGEAMLSAKFAGVINEWCFLMIDGIERNRWEKQKWEIWDCVQFKSRRI